MKARCYCGCSAAAHVPPDGSCTSCGQCLDLELDPATTRGEGEA